MSEAWQRLAASLTADIPQQPAGLTARLREYQMHVSGPRRAMPYCTAAGVYGGHGCGSGSGRRRVFSVAPSNPACPFLLHAPWNSIPIHAPNDP